MSTSYPDAQSGPQHGGQYVGPQQVAQQPVGYGAAQPATSQYGAAQQAGDPAGAAGQPGAAEGLDPKIGGLLAYITWIGGLAMYLTQKHREVRFHAAQSILFNVSLLALWIVLWTAEFFLTWIFSGFGFLTLFLFPLVGLGTFVLWIVLAIRGYNLVHFKLPLIGAMAENWADK